ncbi:MAG: hypothetical protein ACTMIR_01665 [Cellulomonadaceae bacterium]
MAVQTPPATRKAGRAKKPREKAQQGELRSAVLFLIPASIGFVVFYLWPTVR